jgi:hypothetical protein
VNNTHPSLSDYGDSDSSPPDPASSPEALPNNMSLFISEEELEDLAGLSQSQSSCYV